VKEQALREQIQKYFELQCITQDLKLELYLLKTSPRSSLGNVEVSPELNQKISKIQAHIRGFVTRMHLRRERVHKAALDAGILFAMKNTTQGNNYIFYRVM
jgi:hypothetical protein